jgi:hypothetical protein
MSGEVSGNLYLAGRLDYEAEYSCRLIRESGQTVETCPVRLFVQTNISVYPNPTQGSVTIRSAGMKAGDRIDFCNASGTVVSRYQAVEPSQTTLDISSLPKGIYIVNVNGKRVKVIKIEN